MGLPAYIIPIMGKSVPLDPIVIAWLAQLTTSFGSNPSASYISALNTMVVGMRADGDILLLDRFFIFAQEVQGYANVSIVNPASTQATQVNAPTFAVNQGWTFDGVTNHLDTQYNLQINSVNYARNSATQGLYSTGSNSQSNGLHGIFDNTVAPAFQQYIRERSTTDEALLVTNSAGAIYTSGANTDSRGMFVSQRTGANTIIGYKNGVDISTAGEADASVGLVNRTVILGAERDNSSVNAWMARRIAMYFNGSGGVNPLNFYNRFQTFATSIGFNV